MERFETKYDLLDRVYADTRLKRTTKALMQYLVVKSNERSCHPSVATIAKAIRMSGRTVQRHMRYLEQYGYLVRKSRFYRQEQLTNQYEFVLDVMDTSDSKFKQEKIGDRMDKTLAESFEKKDSSFNKMKYIRSIAKTGLSNKECLVLIYFIHKANRDGITYGSIKAISRELRMSQRLLWKIILQLRSEGFFMLKNRKGSIAVKMQEVSDRKSKRVEGMVSTQLYPESENVYKEKSSLNDPTVKTLKCKRKRKSVKQMIRSFIKKIRSQLCRKLRTFLS